MLRWLLCLLIFLTTTLEASELLNLINKERKLRGLSQLKEKRELVCAAARHSADIGPRRICAHTGKDGSSPGTRINACGLKSMAWGEIVACGQRSPQEAVKAWIASPPHNAIMFSRNFVYFGDGMSQNYWTVAFSR